MRKRPLLSYILLNYSLTWIVALLLIAKAHRLFNINTPYNFHYLTAYGPMLAAVLVVSSTIGMEGLRKLVAKITMWKVSFVWYALAFSPLIIYFLISGASYFTGETINFNLLGEINYLPNWGFGALLLWILNSGLGEEVGWRGFVLPYLQRKYDPLKASLILGLFWAGWHLPFFFYLPSYVGLNLPILAFFVIGIVCGSIVYTWLYNNTGGSVLITILLHGSFNFITASRAGEGLPSAVITTLVVISAVVLYILKPRGLRKSDAIVS